MMFTAKSWKIVKILEKFFEILGDALFAHEDDLQRC